MAEFKQYRRKHIVELRPYDPANRDTFGLHEGVSVSAGDRKAGSPKLGDMIARNPKNHEDQWLVAAQYFADNFEPIPSGSDKFKEVSAELDAAIDAEVAEHTGIMTDETDTQAAMGHKAHK